MMNVSATSIRVAYISFSFTLMSFVYFMHYAPSTETLSQYENYINQLELQRMRLPAAKKRIKKTLDEIKTTSDKWESIIKLKTPPLSLIDGGIDLSVNRWQLTVNARKFRDNAQELINNHMKSRNIKVISGPLIPTPTSEASKIVEDYFNYPAIPFPVVIFDLGEISVQGNTEQIESHIKSWNNLPRFMALTHNLKLSGTSPKILATYDLSIIGYIRGNEISSYVPEPINKKDQK